MSLAGRIRGVTDSVVRRGTTGAGERLGSLFYESRSALLDPTRTYRYQMSRRWAEEGSTGPCRDTALWCLLNPSTADGMDDDPTVRRLIGFSKDWGFAAFVVVNLFAYRATVPAALRGVEDPIGPDNDTHLQEAAETADRIIVAWGSHGEWWGRDKAVMDLLRASGKELFCLGTTALGHPKHPLYLAADTVLEPYAPRDAAHRFAKPAGACG